MNNKLVVAIIARDAEDLIADAVKSAQFCDQVLVYLDSRTKDKTKQTAEKHGAKVVINKNTKETDFSRWRNQVLNLINKDWIFYLDADERFTPELKKEILEIINETNGNPKYSAYAVPRANYYLGKRVKHGGAWPDYVERLFYKPDLIEWQGQLHERPIYSGELGYLKNPIKHYTHRNLTSMMEKTIKWTKTEADLIYQSGHPPIVGWRIIRMMLTKFWLRVIKQGAWRDGTVGWINSIFEVFNTFIIYARVWSLQQNEKSDNL